MSLKAILIDTEPHALYILEKQLTTLSDIDIVGTYTDPHLGKEAVITENIDVLFLETLLPQLSGIVLAKQLKEILSKLNIIFVTAHEEYALDAYNLNAIDYVLKPIRKERLQKTVQRLELKNIKSS